MLPASITTRLFLKVILFVFLFNSLIVPAQPQSKTFRQVDSAIISFSKQKIGHVDALTEFVNSSFHTDSHRVRAYYTWIAVNIAYDKELLDHYRLSNNLGLQTLPSLRTQHPDTVFKYRKAVCEGFCLLLNACCEKSGIPAKMVGGITKIESDVDEKMLHTWNAVFTDSVWRLLDITWSGGYINAKGEYVKKFTDRYFFTSPAEFIRDHWPLDAMWQLLFHPVSKKEFMDDSPQAPSPYFNFMDSINVYMKLGREEREYADLLHYHASDPENVNYTLACDYYIYNKAVTIFNLASLYYDDYVAYASRLSGKQVTKKHTNRCIQLLSEPKKLLEEGLAFSAGRSFFHSDISERFQEMVKTSGQRLGEINALIADYRQLLRTF